jgi:hypothetical protein
MTHSPISSPIPIAILVSRSHFPPRFSFLGYDQSLEFVFLNRYNAADKAFSPQRFGKRKSQGSLLPGLSIPCLYQVAKGHHRRGDQLKHELNGILGVNKEYVRRLKA